GQCRRPRPPLASGPRGSSAGRCARGAAGRGRSPSFRVPTVADVPDDELHLSTRAPHRHVVTPAFAEGRAAQRRLPAHQGSPGIDLVGADDLVGALGPVLVLEGDPGTEPDSLGVALVLRGHDGGGVEALLEESDAAVDLPESLLAVDVLGGLAPIALRGRGAPPAGGPAPPLLP